jgi:hypothetical protein
MACTLSTGRTLPCKSAFGGIKSALFSDFGSITALQIDSSTKQVTTLTTSGNWYKYDVKGNSSLETTVTSSRENGTTFYTQTLNLTLTYLDAKTQAELQEIAVARPYIIVEDYYGNYFLCGYENGCELTSGTTVTGAAAGDLSGFTITMEAMEETAPYFLDSTVVPAADATVITPN